MMALSSNHPYRASIANTLRSWDGERMTVRVQAYCCLLGDEGQASLWQPTTSAIAKSVVWIIQTTFAGPLLSKFQDPQKLWPCL